jgi:hypothetical protein
MLTALDKNIKKQHSVKTCNARNKQQQINGQSKSKREYSVGEHVILVCA